MQKCPNVVYMAAQNILNKFCDLIIFSLNTKEEVKLYLKAKLVTRPKCTSLEHSVFFNSAISSSWTSAWLWLALGIRTNMGRQIARMTEGGLILAPGQLGLIQQSQRVERAGSSYVNRGGCLREKLLHNCSQSLNIVFYLPSLFSQKK